MSGSSLAQNPEFRGNTRRQAEALAKHGSYHALELPDGTIIPGLVPIEALRARIQSFPIPQDLRGKRVLDIGAASGWNSFEMERRGAEVMAVDCVEFEELRMAARLMDSKVDYRILDVDELTPQSIGRFDYVLFFGVLYHLRHPLLGLERVCALSKEAAFVESFVTDTLIRTEGCTMEFYETDELGGQIDNWVGPNTNCLIALCRSAGFARVELEHFQDRRAGVTCYRKWEPAPEHPDAAAPRIHAAVNNRTNEPRFHPGKDEYVCVYFTSPEQDLKRDRLRVEIDGYGVPALVLADTGRSGWQVSLKLPPFLDAGRHELRLRTAESGFSNTVAILCGDAAEPAAEFRARALSEPAPRIYAVESNLDGGTIFHGYKNEYLCVWFESAESDLTRETVLAQVGDRETAAMFVGQVGEGRWQLNTRLPPDLEPGRHEVRVRTSRSPYSPPVLIQKN